jgi:hypothetical protein
MMTARRESIGKQDDIAADTTAIIELQNMMTFYVRPIGFRSVIQRLKERDGQMQRDKAIVE